MTPVTPVMVWGGSNIPPIDPMETKSLPEFSIFIHNNFRSRRGKRGGAKVKHTVELGFSR
eukprot:11354487-Ditylum_brightwellii.AAC.1